MPTKTNTTQLVLKKLGKRGKTAATIAEQTGANPNTVGTILSTLVKNGQAQIVGAQPSSGRGRPSNLYALSA